MASTQAKDLRDAIRNGDTQTIEKLLRSNPGLANKDLLGDDWTAMQLGAETGRVEVVRCLAKLGCDVKQGRQVCDSTLRFTISRNIIEVGDPMPFIRRGHREKIDGGRVL
eukprot:c17005_g2_i1.p2 GENE.c17005_g2_i1~~c17005_g2_i1.p2  ORF type:complete len:127 (+),score=22.66 c17005_g2_i1:54-383(+)